MTRITTTILTTLILAAAGHLVAGRAEVALACEDPATAFADADAKAAQAVKAEQAAQAEQAADQESPPRAPRARRSRAPEAPAAPASPEAAPRRAPAPRVLSVEIPEPPALVTPRGWFGFGFQCGECSARAGTGETAAVWEFGTWPEVYSVDSGSPAAVAGLRRGDLITEIDGISIITPEGGRRFGAIRPGQTVRWTVLRDGSPHRLVARAAERPERRERLALTDLRRELKRLNELSDMEQLRKELATLNREMERRRAREQERVTARSVPTRRLRYAGVIGGAEVEVRGPGSIIVSQNEDKEELVINTGESIVVIRVPETTRKRSEQKK